ncbi:thioredoxin-disulfide reductase [Kiritimatiella glycovorans]|uniref:Thioredoxin reductase n=1 Tax=Kiritimatiella glycovorans TaxID=1307763 RepID=A0A0G3EBM3_9BACT|nr:thioredoxin-disulfide reductase [Kiritimatiella glycovorans]AKJ63713.1 Thioredoxin reductase [Kiritimatiella glycovorans]
MENLVILGTGSAGLTAAVYAARADLEPVVVEGDQPGGQLTTTTEVENYPGFPEAIDGSELMQRMHQQAERFGTRFVMASAKDSDFSGDTKKVVLTNGETLEATAVIIATGARAKYLGLDSEQKLIGRGVSACATCDGAFFRDVPVAVVGGGDTAMEEATFLTKFASKVYVVHRRDELRASKIMADRASANDKIEFIWNSVVEEVLGVDENRVTGVQLRDREKDEVRRLEVEGLFLAIGHKPNTDAFRGQLEMDGKGYLHADGTRTHVDGVFAAGDVQDAVYRQAVTAAGSGCMAALEAERYIEANRE